MFYDRKINNRRNASRNTKYGMWEDENELEEVKFQKTSNVVTKTEESLSDIFMHVMSQVAVVNNNELVFENYLKFTTPYVPYETYKFETPEMTPIQPVVLFV